MSYFARSDELPEWAAEVPKGWDGNWLKWSVDLSTKRPTEEEKEALPYISNEDIASWTGKLLIEEPEPAEADSRTFQENDVLFNKLRPYLAKVYHATFDGASSGELLCLQPSQTVTPRFLFYVLVSKGFIDTINAETFGAKMPRADWEIVSHQPLPLPPLDTQRRIARFLDEKTARIDGLIEKKSALLDRLAEKRQALITRAVTKGLNPDAPMDPSGIDWSGDIPEHSQTTVSARPDRGEHHQDRRRDRRASKGAGGITTVAQKVRAAYGDLPEGWTRRRLRFDVRLNPKKSSLDMEPDELVSFIPMDAVGEYGGLDLDDVRKLENVYSGYTYFAEGDLCIAKITPCFENGKGALAEGLTNGVGFGTTELHVVRPGPNIDRRFLFYASISDDFRKLGESEMYGAAGQKRIDESFIKDWMAPLPPLDTQRRIARFLDEKTARGDATAKQVFCSIECLSEYRSAIITAAVTGQLSELQ